MATTGSSGLNNMLANTAVTQTTLPSWYDSAQQNIINQAGTAQQAAPSFANTTGQQAVTTLQGQNNPFTQAQGTLNTISQGASNPWITDPTTGAVTPNTNTAMGGLFAAQQQQLNQTLPNATAPASANAIGSGNFGSLRGETAVDKARGDALATLQAQQMQAAINNQQTGVSAATGLGSVGQAGINADLTTGTAQMNSPFSSVGNYANLVNSVNAPTTASSQTQLSPLNQLGTIGSAGTGLLNSLLGTPASGTSAGTPGTLTQLQNLYSSLFGGNSSGTPTTTNSGATANDISTPVLANATPTDTTNINNIVSAGPADPSGGSINGIDTSI